MLCMRLFSFHNLKSKDVCPDSGMLNPETDKSSTFVLRIMNSKTILSHCLAAAAHNCLAGFSYPCLCLCFGFSQMIRILPFLLITLHFSHIGLTDDLTFTANPPSYCPRNAAYVMPCGCSFSDSHTGSSADIQRIPAKFPKTYV